MSIYIIWSGSIRVTWEDAKAVSKSGNIRLPDKYSITSIQESVSSEVEIESGREFVLTPIVMKATYLFKISCFFVDVFHTCGEISITTGKIFFSFDKFFFHTNLHCKAKTCGSLTLTSTTSRVFVSNYHIISLFTSWKRKS